VSLLVQGAGGGIASSARDQKGADFGGNIMLGGILFQLGMQISGLSKARYRVSHFPSCSVSLYRLRNRVCCAVYEEPSPAQPKGPIVYRRSGTWFFRNARDVEGCFERALKNQTLEDHERCDCLQHHCHPYPINLSDNRARRWLDRPHHYDRSLLQYVVPFLTYSGRAHRYRLDVLDGAMIVLAIYDLNFFHPGHLLS
jgi:hypothetical protein